MHLKSRVKQMLLVNRVIVSFMLAFLINQSIMAIDITVNTTHRGVTIDGFGAFGGMDVHWGGGPWYNEKFLDLVIDTLGFTLMRTVIEPRGEENSDNIWNKIQVPLFKAYKAKAEKSNEPFALYATAWTAPSRFKTNNRLSGGWVQDDKMADYADYLAEEARRWRDEVGIELAAISPVNEPAICPGYHSMCNYPENVGELYLKVGRRYLTHTDVASVTPLSCNDQIFALGWVVAPFVQKIETDPEVDKIVQIASGHYSAPPCFNDGGCDYADGRLLTQAEKNYREFGHMQTLLSPQRPWRRLWNTEFGGFRDSWDERAPGEGNSIPGGAWSTAVGIFNMLQKDFSGIIFWQTCEKPHADERHNVHALFYRGETPDEFRIGPKFYVAKTFSRYLRPGAVKAKTVNSDSNAVWSLAYVHEEHKTVTILLMNVSKSEQTVKISGHGLPERFTVYQTSPTQNCENTGSVSPGGTVTLPVSSITTLYNSPTVRTVKPAAHASKNGIGENQPVRYTRYHINGKIVTEKSANRTALLLEAAEHGKGARKIYNPGSLR